MKVRHARKSLRLDWGSLHDDKAILEGEVRASRYSRLRAKVFVFEKKSELRAFWKKALGHDLGADTPAAVNGLRCDVEDSKTGKRWAEVDPRYFCVMGFSLEKLGADVITHEAVHAGFAYAKRTGIAKYKDEGIPSEEAVCYPAGYVAADLNNLFYESGVYERWEKVKKAGRAG